MDNSKSEQIARKIVDDVLILPADADRLVKKIARAIEDDPATIPAIEAGAKVRSVAAVLAAERVQGWSNPLVLYLVRAADLLEGKRPLQDTGEAVLSASSQEKAGDAPERPIVPGSRQDLEETGQLPQSTGIKTYGYDEVPAPPETCLYCGRLLISTTQRSESRRCG